MVSISLVSFFFVVLLLTVPPCPAICKSGGHVPHGIGATGVHYRSTVNGIAVVINIMS